MAHIKNGYYGDGVKFIKITTSVPEDNLKQLAQLHDENIELKKEIEQLKRQFNIKKVEEAARNHAIKMWGIYKDDIFKHDDIITDNTLSENSESDFKAGALWQLNQPIHGLEVAKKEIERLKCEREWISVKDRLPAITSGFFNCLIFINNKEIIQARFNCKTQRFQNMVFIDIHDAVTHWMPLPKSPL